MASSGSAGGSRRTGVLTLAALIVVGLYLPSLASAAPQGGSPAATSASPGASYFGAASVVYSGSFAARAGYDAALISAATSVQPSTGPQQAVVTFYPNSPSFFVPPPTGAPALSVTQVAERYGLSPSAYAAAEAYFESMGLEVVHTNPTRLSLTVGGPSASMERAFATRLASGEYDGRAISFPQSPPSLPENLEAEVSSVVGLTVGLDLFVLPTGLPEWPTTPAELASASADPDLITPPIARQIYDLSSLYNVSGSSHFASDQGIALLLWGDGYDPSDIQTFFTSDYPSGFPLPTVRYDNVDGAPAPSSGAPSDPSKAPQELTLDMEWAGSMAPGATLDAVYAPDGPATNQYSPTVADMTDALTTAVTGIPGVSVVSMSFGSPENASQPLQSAWATDIATATQEGITLLAATGDTGGDYSASCSGGPSTEFPAISPEVIAVGGTDPSLARNLLGQVTGLASESAWSGSGGGYSNSVGAPSWQLVGSAAGPISAHGDRRGVPDVSAAAAYNYLYYAGQNGVAAGTSFATPLWGGLIAEMDALFGSHLGFVTPRLYKVGASQEAGQNPVGLADVTTGSTCIGSATVGWDPETGWGSPRAVSLYEDLTATFVNLSLSATPSLVAPGGTVTLLAHLTNRTSGVPIAGVPVDVRLASSTGDGPCAGVWGSSDVATNSTGWVSLTVTLPVCYLGGHGSASATVTSDRYYGTNSTTIAVNLLGFYPGLAGIQSYPENVVAFILIMGVGAAIGGVLGRPRQRATPPRASAGPPPGPAGPPSAPPSSPAPPPPSSPSPSGPPLSPLPPASGVPPAGPPTG
jgi:kumamolisin